MKKLLLLFGLLSGFIFANQNEGENIYKSCIVCHGIIGERNALGKSEVIGGMDEKIIESRLLDYKNGKLNKYNLGYLMTSKIKHLSEEEIKLVSIYISNLK